MATAGKTALLARSDGVSSLAAGGRFALVYFVGAEVGYALSLGPAVGGTFWPPSGITLAVFLLAPLRIWPILVAAGAAANFVSDQLHGQTLPASIGFAIANLAEPLIGAYLLRRFVGTPFTFSRLSEVVSAAAVAVFISTPIGAVIGGLTAEWWTENPPGFASSWRTWWIGDACGALVLAPGIVRGLVMWPNVREVSSRTWLEAAAFVLALVIVTQIVFTSPPTSVAMPFLVFPLLLWASLRFGILGVSGGLCIVVLLTTLDTGQGVGPFAAEHLSIGDRLIALQIYVGVMALSFHVLAVVWAERKHAEAALRQAHSGLEARHRRVVEQLPLGVLTLLPDGHVREANPVWQRWGLPFRADTNIHDEHHGEVMPHTMLARVAAGETVELPELWTADGSDGLSLSGIAYPVKDDTGRVAEIVILARDVTSEQRAQQHRERMLEAERSARGEAERLSRMKDEFLATLSHELRTPLNAIAGWVHVLRYSRPDDATLARAVDTIDRNVRAQTALVNELLDVARITAGKVEFSREPIVLAEVVGAAVDSFRPAAETKRLMLAFEHDGKAALVHGDSDRLQQLFGNLLGNAIKFTPPGGRVEMVLAHRDGRAEIVVRDSGEGISPNVLPWVFDRFRQGDGSTTRQHGGLGLGLSIAKAIVELHGGTIRAHSDGEGQGATFTVTLPLASAELPPGARDHAGRYVDLSGLRVLVVDDEPDAREVLRRILADHGCEVAVAGSAHAALAALERFSAGVVVTDIGMPGVDGYELLGAMRQRFPERGFRAVAVTAFARSEDRERAATAGFDAHLAKPVEPMELLRTLARFRAESG